MPLIAQVFTNGDSQAIRLPKEYQFQESELYIQRVGSSIILFPKSDPWKAFEESLFEFSDDFMEDEWKCRRACSTTKPVP